MSGNGPALPNNAPLTGPTPSCSVEVVERRLRMHYVTEGELDDLASGGTYLNLTFFGLCFGCVVSFSIVLYNGGLDPNHKNTYEMLLFAASILAAYFGVRGGRDFVKSKAKLDALKKGP